MRKFFRRLFRRRKPVGLMPTPLTLSHATHIRVLAVHMAQTMRYK